MGVLLGNYIKNGRKDKKLSAQKLCDIVGISRSFLVFIEKGEREPMADKLKLITDALELSYEQAIELQAQDGKQKKFTSVSGAFGTGKTHFSLEALKNLTDNDKEINASVYNDSVIDSVEDSCAAEMVYCSPMKCQSSKSSDLADIYEVKEDDPLFIKNVGDIKDKGRAKSLLRPYEKDKEVKKQGVMLETTLTNILNNYIQELGWQTTINTSSMPSTSDITCIQGDKVWEIEIKNFLPNEAALGDILIRLFGNLSLKITDYNKRYSIATNDKNLFAMLIAKTPKIFTEITSLSYILIEDDGSITLKEMKSYL